VISGGGPDLEVRLVPLLECLRRMGKVAGYSVFDRQGQYKGPDLFPAYDVVIIHQLLPMALHPAIRARKIRYLIDIDGAPIQALAPYGACTIEQALVAVPMREVIYLSGGVLAASTRQAEIMSDYCTMRQPAVYVLPPAFPGERTDRSGPPQAIVYASWRSALLTASRTAVLSAIADFAAQRGVPILNGSPQPGLFKGERSISGAGWAFEAQLRTYGSVIAAVPLETNGGPFVADYVDFQSDLEKALFGSLGIGGVYSEATPFAANGLPTGITVANDYEAWISGLSQAWDRVADPTFANRDEVLRQRALDVVAVNHLLPALKAVARDGQIGPQDLVIPSI